MAFKLANRVKMTVSGTPGTGSITLGSPITGYVSFATGGIVDGDTVSYVIEDGSNWEIGVGTYTASGTVLARTSVTASSAGGTTKISATSSALVFVAPLAADLQSTDTLTSGTLPVVRGGTGITTLTAGYIPFGNGTSAFGNSSNLFWDSANSRLGVGTSSPGRQLNVYTGSATNTFMRPQNTNGYCDLGVTADGTIWGPYATPAANTSLLIGTANSNPVVLWTNGSERLRIDSSGRVGIGSTTLGGASGAIRLAVGITGATGSVGLLYTPTIASDATSSATVFSSVPSTQAATFTVGTLLHYAAGQGTFGANSAVTNQIGFSASSTLTGATNNYGFYGNIASGTGRWNFYAAGTADNYFAGQSLYGSATAQTFDNSISPIVQVIGTTAANSSMGVFRYSSSGNTSRVMLASSRGAQGTPTIAISGDAIGTIDFSTDDGTGLIQLATINTYVDSAPSSGSMPGRLSFWTTPSGSTTATERMRIDSSGSVSIGASGNAQSTLTIGRNITGNANSYGVVSNAVVQSDVTNAYYFASISGTAAATFTCTNLIHHFSTQGTFGANSTVTNQFGFNAASSLTGATNNYGFYSNIASGTGRWNFYSNGTANNAFAGNSRFGGVIAPVATVDVTGSVAATTTILSTGATSGLGYATGAGGAVTQGTSRTTGVTLNNVCGAITLVSAAGSTTYNTFTVTNSAVAATDVVVVSQKSGTDKYLIFVTAVGAGSFQLTFATTGGTTTEQPVFNFAVMKAVAA